MTVVQVHIPYFNFGPQHDAVAEVIATAVEQTNVLIIGAKEGSGKSEFLREVRTRYRSPSVAAALVNLIGPDATPLGILRQIVSDLNIHHSPVPVVEPKSQATVHIETGNTLTHSTVNAVVNAYSQVPDEQEALLVDIRGAVEGQFDKSLLLFDNVDRANAQVRSYLDTTLLPRLATCERCIMLLASADPLAIEGSAFRHYVEVRLDDIDRRTFYEACAASGVSASADKMDGAYESHDHTARAIFSALTTLLRNQLVPRSD